MLQNNGGDDLTITADGSFTFTTSLAAGTAYEVTILTHPSNPAQTCTLGNASGTAGSNVTDVTITCPVYDNFESSTTINSDLWDVSQDVTTAGNEISIVNGKLFLQATTTSAISGKHRLLAKNGNNFHTAQRATRRPVWTDTNRKNTFPERSMSYVVLFEAIPKPGHEEDYLALAAPLNELLADQPGFIAIDRARSIMTEGKLLSISFWESEEAMDAWYNNPQHREAQIKAKTGIFQSIRISRLKVLSSREVLVSG